MYLLFRMNTIYFKVGYCSLFTTDKYEYDVNSDAWIFIENGSKTIINNSTIKLGNWDPIVIADLIKSGWNYVGKVILNHHTWGLEMCLDFLQIFYNQNNQDNQPIKKNKKNVINWMKILNNGLISTVFEKYHEYIEYGKTKTIESRELKTTVNDEPIDELLIPPNLYKKLAGHQKAEIGWMLELEKNHTMILSNEDILVPLLDTGYYLNKNDPSRLYKKNELAKINGLVVNINGGILASDTGTGKTITCIGLLSTDLILGTLPNLLIVTKNILWQWHEEITKFCPQLNIYVVEKPSDYIKCADITSKHIILTHRDMITNATILKCKNNFHSFIWGRIFIDEFHELVLDPKAACFTKLMAIFKWGITGTLNEVDKSTYDSIFELLGITNKLFKNTYIGTNKSWDQLLTYMFTNSIRSNSLKNSKGLFKLPKLLAKTRYVLFTHLQYLIYKSEKMINPDTAYELCSHLTDLWKPPGKLILDSDELAIQYIGGV